VTLAGGRPKGAANAGRAALRQDFAAPDLRVRSVANDS